jgi:hypothetical protein
MARLALLVPTFTAIVKKSPARMSGRGPADVDVDAREEVLELTAPRSVAVVTGGPEVEADGAVLDEACTMELGTVLEPLEAELIEEGRIESVDTSTKLDDRFGFNDDRVEEMPGLCKVGSVTPLELRLVAEVVELWDSRVTVVDEVTVAVTVVDGRLMLEKVKEPGFTVKTSVV